MLLSIEVSDDKYAQLMALAAQLRVSVDALLATTLADFLTRLEAGDATAHQAVFKS